MSDELKPCPFCGGLAEIVDIDEGENAGGSCVCCTTCIASSNVEFGFKENFISNWNRRVQTLAPDAVARLVEAAQPVMWRARHSETEEWQHFNRRPSWREVQPLYAHPPQPSASVVEAMKHLQDIINCGNCSWSRQSARLALRALKGGE